MGNMFVRRGSVGNASACWKAGPSSILGSAPQGGFPHWADKAMKKWREASANGDGWMYCDWMYVCDKNMKINKKSGILPPNL